MNIFHIIHNKLLHISGQDGFTKILPIHTTTGWSRRVERVLQEVEDGRPRTPKGREANRGSLQTTPVHGPEQLPGCRTENGAYTEPRGLPGSREKRSKVGEADVAR